ncbi:MAG: NAD(P)/FAD-dependent oxidoreductase [Pirellula sp.]
MKVDVAIVGGGPGGSTVASFLKKHQPSLDVAILERDSFPRDHVGESQLPPTSQVLHDLGAWDKIEAERFPIKIGASYTWGKTTEPWVFGFIPESEIGDTTRPGKYEGWRRRVALQVDRSRYDQVLLQHAASLGVHVLQPSRVTQVLSDGASPDSHITGLVLEDGRRIEARYYIDASGNAAVIRRELDIPVEVPTLLKNVAFWDYWTAPGLNRELLTNNTVRVLIRSVPFGWLWYIALSDDRTSVGLVCNAAYYKGQSESPEQLYHRAIQLEPQIAGLLATAQSRGSVSTTTDWSYVASRASGSNWFLVGESLGFADPILAAGLTLTHTCAEHCAFTLLELERGQHDADWLRAQYAETQMRRVRQHIKFAEYWYSGNGLFTDVLSNCAAIAQQSGLTMTPQEAFRWLSHGGVEDIPGQFVLGGLGLSGVKSVQQRFAHADGEESVAYLADGMNTFDLDLRDAAVSWMGLPNHGRIDRVEVLTRGASRLPKTGIYQMVFEVLEQHRTVEPIVRALQTRIAMSIPDNTNRKVAFQQAIFCLESMISQGWVRASHTPGMPALSLKTPIEGEIVYTEKLGPNAPRPTARSSQQH